MRSYTDHEKNLLQKISVWHQGKPAPIEQFFIENLFTAESGLALIIQAHRNYAVLYHSVDVVDETRRKMAERDFFETLSLFLHLKKHGYLSIYRDGATKEHSMFFIHESFNKPRVDGTTIVLNEAGDHSKHPDVILDKNGNARFKGSVIDGDVYTLLLHTFTGTVMVSHTLQRLVQSWSAPPSKPERLESNHGKRWLVGYIPLVLLGVATLIFSVYNHYAISAMSQHWQKQTEKTAATQKTKEQPEQPTAKPSTYSTPKPSMQSHAAAPTESKAHYGIDVSRWNGNLSMDLAQIKTLSFGISKATEGVTYIDSEFQQNRNLFRQSGLIHGAYHFYRDADDPVAQAEFYLKIVGPIAPTDMAPIVDIEQMSLSATAAIDVARLQGNILKYLNVVEKNTQRIPVIYTDFAFAERYLQNDVFSRYPLWLADYTNSEPKIPRTWSETGYYIWQRQSNYQLGSTHTDFDIYQGDKAGLLR